MSIEIIRIEQEAWPECVFIGKRGTNWGDWWQQGWFAPLEALPALPQNGDAYLGAVRIVEGQPQRWIGMAFPVGTAAPEGYEAVTLPATAFAVCYLRGPEGSGDFYTPATHQQCLDLIAGRGLIRREGDWCFERYNCPRFTTPDDQGRVVLDYGIAIE